MKLVIVTGMSGAGKTIALKMLEDLGFYCVDNLPISLADKFVQLVSDGGTVQKAALGIDIRSGEGLKDLEGVIEKWRREQMDVQILFLDASNTAIRKQDVPILWPERDGWKQALKRNGPEWRF